MATGQPTVLEPVNLRVDPVEQHMDARYYPFYVGEKLWTVMPAAALVQQHVATFNDFPPRQAPAGFNPQGLVEALLQAAAQTPSQLAARSGHAGRAPCPWCIERTYGDALGCTGRNIWCRCGPLKAFRS